MNKKTFFDIIFIIGLTLFAFCLYGLPALYSPDESRYAEVAREMYTNHNYIVPYINGIIFFHKPPLVYWFTALFVSIFGENTWAVRLGNPLLVCCCLIFSYFTIKTIFQNRKLAILSIVIFTTSLLTLFSGRYLSMDLAVSVFLNMSILSYMLSLKYESNYKKSSLWLFMTFSFSGLAVMSKGLIGIVFPIAIIYLYNIVMLDFKRLFDYRLYIGILISILISVPWILAVNSQYPGFAYYYIVVEQILRFATNEQNREVSIIICLFIFTISFFPWFGLLIKIFKDLFSRKFFKNRKLYKKEYFLLIWGGFILLFFLTSKSFMPLYFTNLIMPFSILIGIHLLRTLSTNVLDRLDKFTFLSSIVLFVFLAITGLIIIFLPLSRPFLYQQVGYLGLTSIVCLAIAYLSFKALKKQNIKKLIILFSIGSIVLANLGFAAGEYISRKNVKVFAEKINSIQSSYNEKIEIYNFDYFYEIPFYTNQTTWTIGDGGQLAPVLNFPHSGANNHIISTDDFYIKWNSTDILSFTVIRNKSLDSFKSRVKKDRFFIIDQTPKNTLIANQKIS
ncbi:4-amino-4-deoxy-L-arabinose transferase-like glycosyltransferase [Allofrancisella inopinata]|uniref:Phospholipid carrier-dependent glycosyltransferase n=1 Tax=Allofrancisella inopinata TaxID=1085647 RepID=A0AAE7CS47_9GAMM|nr:phospholipid carrier-dependent glycosyltransferase [Allofrancisella inopinata]QIV96363.1 phospholipid carrier-dependent glycosyltransferase [Allofrancisella inopinata]TDT73343.1 4-amino-4-deoxy-L-arabinose transferase-like glycosyltransferase [Allofrancisella inopinata]